MRMDRLTTKFQLALAEAQSMAVGRDNQMIEPVHVLKALLDQEGGSAHHLLSKAGANVPILRTDLDKAIDSLPQVQGVAGEVHISPDLSKLLNVTDKLSQQRKDQYISSELFLLAGVDDQKQTGHILKKAGVTQFVFGSPLGPKKKKAVGLITEDILSRYT